jgi:hypothetical protein
MNFKFLAPLLALALTGCLGTLVPKKVELFQDKVKAFPEQSAKLRELERQAIYQSHEKATETVVAALKENSTTNVVAPARDTMKLTQAALIAAGPPEKLPEPNNVTNLVAAVEQGIGKYNVKVEKFAANSDENVGKKIEGTGLIQVPYILWTGGAVLGVIIIFVLGKIALSAYALVNPAAGVGLGVVNAAQSVVTKGFTQIVKGGEDFKNWVVKEVGDQGLQDKILSAFQVAHKQAQDKDVQDTVKALTQ